MNLEHSAWISMLVHRFVGLIARGWSFHNENKIMKLGIHTRTKLMNKIITNTNVTYAFSLTDNNAWLPKRSDPMFANDTIAIFNTQHKFTNYGQKVHFWIAELWQRCDSVDVRNWNDQTHCTRANIQNHEPTEFVVVPMWSLSIKTS